jgi:DNA primase catalytic subunit
MNTFIHQNGLSLIEKDGKRLEAFMKPDFSFQYDDIQFHENSQGYVLNDNWLDFTPEQVQELTDYINGQEENPQGQINFESMMYLQETDWYITRRSETGAEVPQEVLIKRQEARESIQNNV